MRSKSVIVSFILGSALTLAALLFGKDMLLERQGLSLIDSEQLTALELSQQRLLQAEQVISEHKASIKARPAKRVVTRVTAATSATFVPSLDSALVPVIVLGMEAQDYCEQQQELQAILDVFSGAQTDYNMQACLDDIQQQMQVTATDASKEVEAAVDDFLNSLKSQGQALLQRLMDAYQAP